MYSKTDVWFTTKAVILANYELDTDDLEYINASYLGAYVLNKMDLEISDYFMYIDSARTVLPVFDKNCAWINGETIPIEELSGEMLDTYNELKYVNYRWFYDYADYRTVCEI